MAGNPLAAILAQGLSAQSIDDMDSVSLSKDVQVLRLNEVYERYRDFDFEPGDVVTPRGESGLRHAGKPHLIMEVLDPPHYAWFQGDETGDAGLGARLDIRVAVMVNNDNIQMFWGESWRYEKMEVESEY